MALTCYSETQRIVLLIDLDPVVQNPNLGKTLISFLTKLLSFPPLSSSLFSFKPFFSSLSPLLSTTSPSLSFDLPSSTLRQLSHTLSSPPPPPPHPFSPKPSHLSSSLSQLLHHYPWDSHNQPHPLPPYLVLFFPPSFHSLPSFHDVLAASDDAAFSQRLSFFFDSVSRAFRARGIHCTWIADFQGAGDTPARRLIETGLAKLGWGFCGLDSLVLGSALVPFGLLYPKIGVSWASLRFSSSREIRAVLNLRMLDVNRKPIEYNCCDLEFVDFRVLDRGEEFWGQDGVCGRRKERFWKLCMDGVVKLEVKVVRRCDAFVELGKCLSELVVVREVFGEVEKKNKNKGGSDEFFADRALEVVAKEFGWQWQRKPVPVWEMLLSFLYKEGCWALVSITNANGGSCLGVLRPFTVFAALLSVIGDLDPCVGGDFGEANVARYIRTPETENCKFDLKLKKTEGMLDSQGKKIAMAVEGSQKKKMIDLNELQSFTWSLFCDLAYNKQLETDLHEVYYAMECNRSKKLKFLKCWMKQMRKSCCSDLALSEEPKPNPTVVEEGNSKSNGLPQNAEQPISSFASAESNPEPEALRIQDNAVLDSRSETCEAFFGNLSNKINQGIESVDVELGALAQRLVNSCIYWQLQKVDRETISQSNSPLKGDSACGSMIAFELIKLLLREPKEEIATKHKGQNPFSQPSDSGLATLNTEHVVREYELQILFRMEILQSEVGSGVKDSIKQKFVEQICLFLANIQRHMEEGYFGDWCLEIYVAKIIKNRYSLTLEDVVQEIYNKMDLLLFADDDEAPNSLLNSEDSSKSLNKKVFRDEAGENYFSNEPFSPKNEPSQLQQDDSGRFQGNEEKEHNKKLIEAHERRERARRLSSFTSWMPDLQRVWAPKQKGVMHKTDPLRKVPKRKEWQRTSYGTVCETPMTGNKRSSSWTRGLDDGSETSGSVTKALFKGDL